MSPKAQERLFPRDYAHTLIAIAHRDLETGAYMASGAGTTDKVRPESVLFFFHQASEKALKAALCHLGIRLPMIHDLAALLAKFPDDVQPPVGYELAELNDYAGVLRYQEGRFPLTREDLAEAHHRARMVVEWSRSVVGEQSGASPVDPTAE